MGKKKETMDFHTDKIAMTPDEVKEKYLETHTSDGKTKEPPTVAELDPEDKAVEEKEQEPEPEQKPIDIEQLKKDATNAIQTLTTILAVLNQLVIIPDEPAPNQT